MRDLILTMALSASIAPVLAFTTKDFGAGGRSGFGLESRCGAAAAAVYRCKFDQDLAGGSSFALHYSNDPG